MLFPTRKSIYFFLLTIHVLTLSDPKQLTEQTRLISNVLKEKINILMLGWEYPPAVSGGLGVATQQLVEALEPHANVTLLLPDTTEEALNNYKHQPSIISNYAPWSPFIQKATQIQPEIQEKAIQLAQQKTIGQEKIYGQQLLEQTREFEKKATLAAQDLSFDWIHAHDWMTFSAALRLQKEFKKPLAIHLHSLETDRVGNPHARNEIYQIEKRAIQKADLVLPVSEYTKGVIAQQYVPKRKHIISVHNGASFSSDASSTQSEVKKIKKKKHQILFLGRITAQKGVDTFMRTAKRLVKKHKKAHFVVAGLGDQLAEMMQEATDSQLASRIEFRGFVSRNELPELLQSSSILFMPSVSEPFGLAAVEAAQFGLPIVISNQSGAIEILPGVLTAEYWDSKTFARHISMLLKYKSLRKGLGKANKQAMKNYSWKHSALKVLKAYETVEC